jgi:hypothetical protein
MKFIKQITDFLEWDQLVYPPRKIKDIHSINGVRLNQPIIKEVLWAKYINDKYFEYEEYNEI